MRDSGLGFAAGRDVELDRQHFGDRRAGPTAFGEGAAAAGTTVTLSRDDDHLAFEVTDDGAGFDPKARGYGTGMQGMADRLAALGGELTVTSSPGAGTTVRRCEAPRFTRKML